MRHNLIERLTSILSLHFFNYIHFIEDYLPFNLIFQMAIHKTISHNIIIQESLGVLF